MDNLGHPIGAASGWGGSRNEEAFYLNVEPGLIVGTSKIEVLGDGLVGVYWSASQYSSSRFAKQMIAITMF
ncbi:MAG: hypothetical protein JJ897_20245 [Marinibacterium sp.]|nr:hypothetical protein [Marinibacterium sp.]